MKIDLFCLDFLSRFFTSEIFHCNVSCIFFSECVPVIKEKATQPGPQTTGKGRYKCYWNWLLIFPMLTACPLRQRAVSSLHTEHRGFPLIVGVLFIHVFSVCSWKLLGSLVTSYYHAFSAQSWLVHCVSVNVTSQCKVRPSLTFEAQASLLLLEIPIQPLKGLLLLGVRITCRRKYSLLGS